jgi:hypothetical protein
MKRTPTLSLPQLEKCRHWAMSNTTSSQLANTFLAALTLDTATHVSHTETGCTLRQGLLTKDASQRPYQRTETIQSKARVLVNYLGGLIIEHYLPTIAE